MFNIHPLHQFVGTTVFLLLGLGSIQAVTAEAAATSNSSSNIERVLYVRRSQSYRTIPPYIRLPILHPPCVDLIWHGILFARLRMAILPRHRLAIQPQCQPRSTHRRRDHARSLRPLLYRSVAWSYRSLGPRHRPYSWTLERQVNRSLSLIMEETYGLQSFVARRYSQM